MGETIMPQTYLDDNGNPTTPTPPATAPQYLDDNGNPTAPKSVNPASESQMFAATTSGQAGPTPAQTPMQTVPSPSNIGSRAWQAVKDETGNVVQSVAAPVKAVIMPPQDASEHAIVSIGGPGALVAYRTARGLHESAQNLVNCKKETFQQSVQDFQNALNEFHNRNYRAAMADTASMVSDMGSLQGEPLDTMGRTRELAQGTKEGGDFVTPLTKDVVDLGAAALAEKAPEIVRGAGKVVEATSEAAGKAAEKINTMELRPEALQKPAEPPKPVAQHVGVETPLDDATLRKSFDKKLSEDARDTLREHVGDTIPAGGSVETTLLKAVKPANETIQQQGLALNKVLQDAGPLKTSAGEKIGSALGDLKNDLPGGTEETFGKAIDKELARAKDVMQSTDPTTVNDYIRELDKRIDSYQSPEEPIDSPSQAADAARVIIRRILRDKINTEVPGTKPINDILGKNLELRKALRKKFGDVAYDPVAAESQHLSELRKGTDYMDYEQKLENYTKTWKNIKTALVAAGVSGGVIHTIDKLLGL
jgi:hypothetical protein